MDLQSALKGMFNAEDKLRSVEGINNPTYMSTHMMRLSQYIGAVESHLAEAEKSYEIKTGQLLAKYLGELNTPVTKADKQVKIDLAEDKGNIVYLTRLVGSGWKQVGVIQSRINHLVRESQL